MFPPTRGIIVNAYLRIGFAASLVSVLLAAPAHAQSPVTIEDAIRMVRVPHFWGEQPFFAISDDGRSGAAVTWQGDLGRNVNLYKIYVFNVAPVLASKRLPEPALQLDFKGDTNDYGFRITGVDGIREHTDQKTHHPVATFLHGDPHQLYAVDGVTRKVRVLTKHSTHVRAYAM